jgi:di/tripeptidase
MRILICAAAVAGLMASAAYAAVDLKGEISTAEEHAGYSAAAKTLNEAHMHLHHTVNCIVGPNGPGFDASQINPCAGRGNGAIPDSTDAGVKQKLQAAADEAQKGLAANDLKAAQAAATQTVSMLKALE